ncbi:MAG: prepilin-type N-terminal cleavage/methylation domain-containing protein [Phycisphaerales bacterium]|nr:prepilin-type N-terminal cleavage/methylation domain-containing protein [Planctomycetota bacterium]MCH8508873.1 prepilin-type N-terminal cleavage/methylation domain-containing protein [Phycisphaerales bacterium]
MNRVRRGFTLIETVLAAVVGAMVLLGCVSVFMATNRAERAFGQRYERTSEMWTTQLAFRRSFMQLLMEEQPQTAQAAQAAEDQDLYPRVLLTRDAAMPADAAQLYGWHPQRLEITVARSPVPSILGSQLGSWLVEADRANSLDFTSSDLSSGAIRGVFELRPSGTRELLMAELGLADPDPRLRRRMETDPPRGWTLWWRPMLSTELAELDAGFGPRADTAGSPEEMRRRLAGAIRLLGGIDVMTWEVYKGGQMVRDYAARTIPDLPAFIQLEVLLLNGQYASWMFEIGWTAGEDPIPAGSGPGAGDDPDAPGPGGPGGPAGPGGPGGPGAPGRPGGRQPPGNAFDVGGARRSDR